MRILTVRQPWAWAIIHGGKDVENRTRNIAGDYRGPVAIHAGLAGASFDSSHPGLWPFDDRHVFGSIIGIVDLVGVHVSRMSLGASTYGLPVCFDDTTPIGGLCSPWAQYDEIGIAHLVLANPRSLPEPILYKGALGLRTLPAEVEAQIWAQIGPS